MSETFGQDTSPIFEYLRILRRRKWLIGFIAITIMSGAVAIAFMLPVTYQSTATILIEEPAVSDDLAKTSDTSFADQRLQLIQQRVMTTAKLVDVIDRIGLYREVRQTTPANLLADDMRSRITLKLVGADTADAKSSRSARATTAFTLSYVGGNPVTTQQVAAELVKLYIAENEQSQRSRAVGTAGFLTAESNRLAAQIKDLEAKLADFKTKNAGMLPEEMTFNTQLLDRTQNQLLEFMRQAQAARERQAFMQAQLLTLEPLAPVNSSTPEALSPKARLRLLKAQYSALNAKYGAQHPDVVNLRRQIESLNGSAGEAQLTVNLNELEAQLAAANQKYGKAHPEVLQLTREIEAARKIRVAEPVTTVEAPDNPVYIQTQGQLSAVNAELNMAAAQIAALQDKMNDVEERILKSPEVERTYVALKREHDTAVAKYDDLQERENQAELAKNLETEQMGERLSLIEPPPLPNAPISPNRPAIILLGVVLALSCAVAAAILADSLDGRIYGHRRLTTILGQSPLVFVPRIQSANDRRPRGRRIAMIMVSAVALIGILLFSGDVDLSPLRSIWTSIVDQMGTL